MADKTLATVISEGNYACTPSVGGFMSAADKTKLNGIPTGGAGSAAPVTTTADFAMPAIYDSGNAGTVAVAVTSTSGYEVGQALDFSTAGVLKIVSVDSSTQVTVRNYGVDGNAA